MTRRGLLALLLLGCVVAPGRAAEPSVWREPVTGMEFVRLPAGRFTMGSPMGEVGREEQEASHEVVLTRPFYIGRYEVTRAQWEQLMGPSPGRRWAECGGDCPVVDVDWLDAREFIRRLRRLAGGRYRLPTEAEWEYACRAGTTTPFATGEHLSTDEANFDGRYPYGDDPPGVYRETPTPVGTFAPNPWGIFDLHGNVWEWVEDEHCPYPQGPVRDPVGHCGADLQVIRGGSWYFNADSARCGLRYTHRPQDSGFSLGFRLVREVDAPDGARAPGPAAAR